LPRKKFAEINDVRMAYIDEGEGDPIVFQHGNPTSSYLLRNVIPHLEGLGRLIACDLVGTGDSGKLPGSGPDRYSFQEQRDYLFALWERFGIEDNADAIGAALAAFVRELRHESAPATPESSPTYEEKKR
jgi:haloalkane dehalogenase